jgi:malonyl-CoA O-methyltransferase
MQVAAKRLKHNFGKAALGYDAQAKFQQVQTRRVMDAALMLLPETATMADIGCGTGYFAAGVRVKRPAWRVLGVDMAPGMCAVANERCTAIAGDATQLPLASGSLDAAVSSLCYQWVENHAAAFTELARVLKPGGRAIIASLGEASLQELRSSAGAAELPLSLLPMQGFDKCAGALVKSGLNITFSERRVVTEHYPSVRALLDSMRAIGAGNNFATSPMKTAPKRWAAMVAQYERLREARGIPATWEHHFFVLRKPR